LDPDAFAELDPLMKQLPNDVTLFRVQVPQTKKGKTDLGDLSMEEAQRVIMDSEPMKKNRLYVWIAPLPF
jgi:hypothetical protein